MQGSGSESIGSAAAAVLLPGFVGTELPDWLARRLAEGLGGVCLFGENIVDRAQLRRLTDAIRAANPHALIAIDEEGGDVTRVYAAVGSPYAGNALLGRIDDLELTARVGATVAGELAALGVNLNFAPDVDVNSNPDNPVIGVRSFGDDAARVARHATAWIAAHEAAGVAVSAKHFPGHGDSAEDSHLALPVVDASAEVLRSRELVPFAAAVDAGARTVMTSHLVLPQLDPGQPATFSRAILQGILREEFGFDGLIVTDALDMAGASAEIGIPAAAVRALAAGCDLLCIGTRNTDAQLAEIQAAIEAALDDGALPTERLAEAAARVRRLGAELARTVPSGTPAEASDAVEPAFDVAQVAAAIEVRDGLVLPSLDGPDAAVVVAIETEANIAVGDAPWGLGSVGVAVQRIGPGQRLDEVAPGNVPLLLIGKANHRTEWVRALIDEARAQRPTVVVDMGWPSSDRAYADVATFGASRLAAAALLQRLGARMPEEATT